MVRKIFLEGKNSSQNSVFWEPDYANYFLHENLDFKPFFGLLFRGLLVWTKIRFTDKSNWGFKKDTKLKAFCQKNKRDKTAKRRSYLSIENWKF